MRVLAVLGVILVAIATLAAAWFLLVPDLGGQTSPEEDAARILAASCLELRRTRSTVDVVRAREMAPGFPGYRLLLTERERADLAEEVRRSAADQAESLTPPGGRSLSLFIDGEFMPRRHPPRQRAEAGILRRFPEFPAAMEAIEAVEDFDDWKSRFAGTPGGPGRLAAVLGRFASVLVPREIEGIRSSLEDRDDRMALADALANLFRRGDDALRWSSTDRAFVTGKTEKPLFARFRKDD